MLAVTCVARPVLLTVIASADYAWTVDVFSFLHMTDVFMFLLSQHDTQIRCDWLPDRIYNEVGKEDGKKELC